MQSTTRPGDRATSGAVADQPQPLLARLRPGQWLPPLVLTAGLLLGVGLWGQWGPVIALGRVISYCF